MKEMDQSKAIADSFRAYPQLPINVKHYFNSCSPEPTFKCLCKQCSPKIRQHNMYSLMFNLQCSICFDILNAEEVV